MQGNNKLNEYIESFLEMMTAERGASRNTIESYKHDLLDFSAFLARKYKGIMIESASSDMIASYMNYLAKSGLSEKTSSRRLSSLKQFFQFLYTDNIRPDNPANSVDRPKSGRSLPKYLSEKEIELLLETAAQDNSPEGIRLSTFLEILYASGLRVTELVTLKKNALQKTAAGDGKFACFLTVKGKGNKERIVPLHNSAIKTIEEYCKYHDYFSGNDSKNDYLFPSRGIEGYLTRQRLGQLLKQLAIDANINPEKVSPHILRHSFASHLLNHGMDLRVLQELLGHSDISTTQIYTHIADEKLKSLVQEKHPLARKHKINA